MTRLLEKAFEEATRLPEVEQNALAKSVLDELHSERDWMKAFEGNALMATGKMPVLLSIRSLRKSGKARLFRLI